MSKVSKQSNGEGVAAIVADNEIVAKNTLKTVQEKGRMVLAEKTLDVERYAIAAIVGVAVAVDFEQDGAVPRDVSVGKGKSATLAHIDRTGCGDDEPGYKSTKVPTPVAMQQEESFVITSPHNGGVKSIAEGLLASDDSKGSVEQGAETSIRGIRSDYHGTKDQSVAGEAINTHATAEKTEQVACAACLQCTGRSRYEGEVFGVRYYALYYGGCYGS